MLDKNFDLKADGTENEIRLLPEGKLLVGGRFTTLCGTPSVRLAKLIEEDPANEALGIFRKLKQAAGMTAEGAIAWKEAVAEARR